MSPPRMPPGFMNAIWAPPRLAGCVATSWASAMTSPDGDLAERVRRALRMSAVTLPITLLASGADAVTYCCTTPATRSSLGRSSSGDVGGAVPRVARVAHDRRSSALAATSSPDLSSIVSVMSLRMRPNDAALVIEPRHAVRGGDRAPVLGVRVGGHDDLDRRVEPLRDRRRCRCRPGCRRSRSAAAVPDWKPPWWITSTLVFTPCLLQLLHGLVGGVGLVDERQPGHAGRRDDGRRGLEHLADDADLELLAAGALDLLGAVGREQGLPVVVADDVGRQVLEVGTRVACWSSCRWRARRASPCSRRPAGSRRSGSAAARPSPCRTRGCRPTRSRRSSGW